MCIRDIFQSSFYGMVDDGAGRFGGKMWRKYSDLQKNIL